MKKAQKKIGRAVRFWGWNGIGVNVKGDLNSDVDVAVVTDGVSVFHIKQQHFVSNDSLALGWRRKTRKRGKGGYMSNISKTSCFKCGHIDRSKEKKKVTMTTRKRRKGGVGEEDERSNSRGRCSKKRAMTR